MKRKKKLDELDDKFTWLGHLTVEQYFSSCVLSEKIIDYHFDIKIPYIYIDNKKLIYNPVLKDIEFYKVIDSVTAFQEVSMFISGVLGGNSPEMVQLEDKELIQKHGFNKLSFRKEKQK